jgi:hypothetical protein
MLTNIVNSADMNSTKIIFEDSEKAVHEVLGDFEDVPQWILMGGTQIGQCMLTYNASGGYDKSSMYYGADPADSANKIFVIQVKNPVRDNEVYGIAFQGTKISILSCYNEGPWEIPFSTILKRFPDLNQIPELKAYGKKYAVPGLIFDTNSIVENFEAHKSTVTKLVSDKLKDLKVLGFLEREGIHHWQVGMYSQDDLKLWVPIRLMWNKIKHSTDILAKDIVYKQDAILFDHNIESSRVILNQVIKPFCDEHNATRIAKKHDAEYLLHEQQQWLSIQLSKLVRDGFVEVFQNE